MWMKAGGECLLAMGACFRCSQPSHMIRECLQNTPGGTTPEGKVKTQVKAKVYAITLGEVDLEMDEVADAGVITGKVRLIQHVTYALFDSGVSRSFVYYDCGQRCRLCMEPLSRKVLVAILDGKIVGCTRVVKDCRLEVAGLTLIADLIVFHLMGFDFIVGMDWLSKHYAKIDCRQREIVFDLPSKDRICYMREVIGSIPSIVMTGRVKKSTQDERLLTSQL
ncbi:uncharacterized protein LOC118348590 [Juglans regia]|uniref:Uncharacterized protein LOC118348590 n=1 Tax=Juglans regia TaxID=51240 RepID=A0A6P9EGP0_JUGRE|nr:uncharacterized protein LOC118348590 [Juglans regia]